MNVEILNVGTELLLGEIVNTNATVLTKLCKDLGFNVYYQSVVGDNPQRILDCLALAFERGADCVMTTGGLGPTTDDLTKELSAQYLGLEMIYNEEEARKVYEKCCFISNMKHVSDNNFKQAYYPKDAYILENKMGTANGCIMSKDEKMIINLPGPPKELKAVIESSLLPFLEKYKQDRLYTYEYITMFIGESQLDDVLKDIIEAQDEVSIALYAGEETVRVRLAVKTSSQQKADEKMAYVKRKIEERIAQYIVNGDLKSELIKNLPSLSIEYRGDFRLQDDFLKPYISDHPQIHIIVETKKKTLGEVIMFQINDYCFEVPVFQKAEFSYGKIEARFIAQLYKYIFSHQKN